MHRGDGPRVVSRSFSIADSLSLSGFPRNNSVARSHSSSDISPFAFSSASFSSSREIDVALAPRKRRALSCWARNTSQNCLPLDRSGVKRLRWSPFLNLNSMRAVFPENQFPRSGHRMLSMSSKSKVDEVDNNWPTEQRTVEFKRV
jgi:hypothetical protein